MLQIYLVLFVQRISKVLLLLLLLLTSALSSPSPGDRGAIGLGGLYIGLGVS